MPTGETPVPPIPCVAVACNRLQAPLVSAIVQKNEALPTASTVSATAKPVGPKMPDDEAAALSAFAVALAVVVTVGEKAMLFDGQLRDGPELAYHAALYGASLILGFISFYLGHRRHGMRCCSMIAIAFQMFWVILYYPAWVVYTIHHW